MVVPEEIRAVRRPKNTVVVPSGSGYRVRQRSGCRYVEGRRVPIEGCYIGSIVNGVFVPDDPVKWTGSTGRVDIKYYGRVRFCDTLNGDVLRMLNRHYNLDESKMIYCMAMIRACYPGTRDYQMEDRYLESYISEMFPGVSLGKNQVCTELRNLGKEYSRIRAFMKARVCSLEKNDILVIDGCLKQKHGRIDTLSQVSRKTKHRKHKDILMMYAYSLDLFEPVCSKIYPGNMVDSRAVGDFIKTSGITGGLIVADKGFPPSVVMGVVADSPDLHYLVPHRRDAQLVIDHDMYSFDGTFMDEGPVEFKKVRCEGFWLYSFRDLEIARDQEEQYLRDHPEGGFDGELSELRREFGTVVFQCDLDIPPSKVYSIYQGRWMIELMFKFYQTDLDFDDTRVQSDYSEIGSDFVDFLSVLMGSRMLNAFHDTEGMNDWTFKASMDFLDRLKMVRIDDSEEWEMNRIPLKDAELMAEIGILDRPVVPVEVKKRGRPKGSKDTKPRKTRSDKGVPKVPGN
ncbi:MAG: transposase [Candidatus Methanomethylophilaceae archaeon]|nr:transposase [Candidatus Methanomethylophilaceae archaeon]